VPEPPDRQRIRSELDSLTRSRHGANRRETLHERCPYLCGLDVVERSTPPDVAPGFVAVRLLERALERIDGEPARALTAMLALGEGQSVNPQSDRDTRARELLGRENKATFKPRSTDLPG